MLIRKKPASWAGRSVCIERITHMSSANSPSCGNSSLISSPLWPRLRNLNGEPSRFPVTLSVFGFSVGMGLPWYFCSTGL